MRESERTIMTTQNNVVATTDKAKPQQIEVKVA